MSDRNNHFQGNPNTNGTTGAVDPRTNRPSSHPAQADGGFDSRLFPNEERGRMTEPLPPALRNVQLPEATGQEVLRGTLGAFSPSSLLSLLNIQKSTGYLRVRNAKSEGFIYVDKGEVYDAGLGSVGGALALFQLFGWRQGEFRFEIGGAVPARRTIEASLPVLQVRATLWLDNMNKYMPIIPSTSHRIAIASEPRSEVVIEPYQWPVLTKIVSRPLSIAQLAAELDQDLMTITRIAADLVKMGVAIVHEPNPDETE